jgi:hypothetical protein
VVAVQVDLLDLADLDPGDPYFVARLEPARFREGRAVRPAAADQRETVGVERGEGQQREGGESGGADDDGVAVPERDQARQKPYPWPPGWQSRRQDPRHSRQPRPQKPRQLRRIDAHPHQGLRTLLAAHPPHLALATCISGVSTCFVFGSTIRPSKSQR